MAIPSGSLRIQRTVTPGENLRRMRIRLGLSTRRVSELSLRVAEEQGSSAFSISHARLVQIENEESIPSIHKLFTLSCIYGIAVQELFGAYFNPQSAEQRHASIPLPNTHLASFADNRRPPTIPFQDSIRSTPYPCLANRKGVLIPGMETSGRPLYGFVGVSDHTMHPLIPAGSMVEIQPCRRVADPVPYRSEWERPVYFLESRSGYLCCWCSIHDGKLFSIPHPLSPCRPQVFAFPSEVEVVGGVTGIALRQGSSSRGRDAKRTRLKSIEALLEAPETLQPDNSAA